MQGYARQAMTFGTVTNGSASSSGTITFPALVGADVTVAFIAIYDSLTTGNLLYHTPVVADKTLSADDVMIVASGGISVTIN